jgi:hypothetical protein
LEGRISKAVYVGSFYSGKVDRLVTVKQSLGKQFDIYGRFPLDGYSLALSALLKRRILPYRVKPLSVEQREKIYGSYSVGLNMHLSQPGRETGNARLYELAYRGVAQVVDQSGCSDVHKIFIPDKEILTYSTEKECIEKLKILLSDKNLRCSLAERSLQRAFHFYDYEKNLIELIDWFGMLCSKRSLDGGKI